MIIPPFRFAIVEEGLYRSSQPRSKNVLFLQRLKFKTLLSLTPKPISSTDPAFVSAISPQCTCYHVAVQLPKDNVPLHPSQVMSLIRFLLDASHHPILVHCLDGKTVVGIVMMCLRKIQGWDLPCIFNEQARSIRGDELSNEEMNFVGKFGGELNFSVPFALPLALDTTTTAASPSNTMTTSPTNYSNISGPAEAAFSMHSLNRPFSLDWEGPNADPSTLRSISSSVSPSCHALQDNLGSHYSIDMPSTYSLNSIDEALPPYAVPKWFWGGTIPLKKHVYPCIRIKTPSLLLEKAQTQAQKQQKQQKQQKEDKKSDLKTRLLTDILTPSYSPSVVRQVEESIAKDNPESEENGEGEQNVSRMVQALNLEGFLG